jgi:hypothetical protein
LRAQRTWCRSFSTRGRVSALAPTVSPEIVAASVASIAVSEPPDRRLSALPSPAARAAAFAAICLGGLAGALIGYSLVRLQCDGDCAVPLGLGIFVGSIIAAAGMSIVAVLVLRAVGEWRELQDHASSARGR